MIAAESNSAIPKIRARFTLLIALAILAAGCSPKATPKLIVGMELAYPPFEMTDPQGRATGVSVDLARAFGKFLGQEIQIQNLPFDGLIPSLQTRKIDLIISSLTATPERANKGNPELVQKVNAFLKEFRARGGFDELGDRYLQEQKQAFRQMGIPFYF